jgi:spore coat protein H
VLLSFLLVSVESCSSKKKNKKLEPVIHSLPPYPLSAYYLTLNEDSLNYIYQNYEEDIYITARLSMNDEVYEGVKLRIRGDSSREFDKKSLKLKLPKGMKLADGAKKINLNADYGDKTMVHQYLASKTMNDFGQICFRSGYVPLYINDQFYGLYLRVENIDDRFLKSRNLSKKNNLYKASKDYACMVDPKEVKNRWEKKTNTKTEGSEDLEELIENLQEVEVDVFDTWVKEHFFYDELINIIALNILISNSSTYYHNYYMYHDLIEEKWRMLPWDMDKTFNPDHINYNYQKTSWAEGKSSGMNTNTLIEKCFANQNTLRDVRNRIVKLKENYTKKKYQIELDDIQSQIQQYVLMDTTNKVNSSTKWQSDLSSLLQYIELRTDSVLNQIDHKVLTFMVDSDVDVNKNEVEISWEEAIDPNNLPITYTIHYALDGKFKKAHQKLSGLTNTSAVIKNLSPGNYQFYISASNLKFTTYGHDIRNRFTIP